MAATRISALQVADPIVGDEELAVVQSGATKKTTPDNILMAVNSAIIDLQNDVAALAGLPRVSGGSFLFAVAPQMSESLASEASAMLSYTIT